MSEAYIANVPSFSLVAEIFQMSSLSGEIPITSEKQTRTDVVALPHYCTYILRVFSVYIYIYILIYDYWGCPYRLLNQGLNVLTMLSNQYIDSFQLNVNVFTSWSCRLQKSPFICTHTVPAGRVTRRHRWSHARLNTASSAVRRGVTPRKKAAVSSCATTRKDGRGGNMLSLLGGRAEES